MQKAPVMKGSGLKPLEDTKPNEEVHVFGRNLEERVLTKDEEDESVLKIQNTEEDDIDSIRKRKFDAITGEEDEETIFQSDFKLFVWDLTTSNWIEKGRGQLRLNDSINQDERKSRLIMRVSGTLRIILNVAINRSYFRVLANSKTNIRFTDSQTVWAASGSNANQLKDLIEERLMVLAEDENEIRKKSKSAGDVRGSSKKTKPEIENKEQQPSIPELSQEETKTNELDRSKQEVVSSSDNNVSSASSDSDDNYANEDTEKSNEQYQEEESKRSESTDEINIKSNGAEKSPSSNSESVEEKV